MRVIYAVQDGHGGYRFVYQRHDDPPPHFSRLMGRCDDEDARLMIDWCYEKQREGWSLTQIERGF